MNILIGLIVGLVFFIATITAYTLGLKHEKQLSNNQIPVVNLNPVKPIVEAIEQHTAKKEQDKAVEELTDIMGATKESMLEAIRKEKVR